MREQVESEKSENLFLYLDMPRFDFPVVFSEPVRPSSPIKRTDEYRNISCRRSPPPSPRPSTIPFNRSRQTSLVRTISPASSTRRLCAIILSRRNIVVWSEVIGMDPSIASSNPTPRFGTSSTYVPPSLPLLADAAQYRRSFTILQPRSSPRPKKISSGNSVSTSLEINAL